MTDKTQLVTFTPEERAILDGTATVKVEETDGAGDGADASDAAGKADAASPTDTQTDGQVGDADPKPEGDSDDAEEEPTEVADGTNPDGQPKRKVIAFSAYDKQRHRANKLSEEATKLREQVAYLSGLSQQQPKPQPQAQQQPTTQELSETPPDKAKEPEKYLAWLEAVAQETVRMRRQSVQQTEQQTQFQQINQTVFEHEQAFINGDPSAEIEPHPDFHEAVKFLQDKHKAELKEAGYNASEVQQIMAARAQSVALKALEAGKSPAERVYSLAKLNGYKKPAAVVKETEAEKIARQAKSQEKAGKTISSLPGGESKGGLTAETLANMDPAAFKKAWDSGEAKKLMGWKD